MKIVQHRLPFPAVWRKYRVRAAVIFQHFLFLQQHMVFGYEMMRRVLLIRQRRLHHDRSRIVRNHGW